MEIKSFSEIGEKINFDPDIKKSSQRGKSSRFLSNILTPHGSQVFNKTVLSLNFFLLSNSVNSQTT